MKKSQQSLVNWTKQKWRTKSGKPSTQGSEVTTGLPALGTGGLGLGGTTLGKGLLV